MQTAAADTSAELPLFFQELARVRQALGLPWPTFTTRLVNRDLQIFLVDRPPHEGQLELPFFLRLWTNIKRGTDQRHCCAVLW